jgi:hypothetical protein
MGNCNVLKIKKKGGGEGRNMGKKQHVKIDGDKTTYFPNICYFLSILNELFPKKPENFYDKRIFRLNTFAV